MAESLTSEPQSHDTTHTDMLLPGVQGEAAEEEASMLQSSIPHHHHPPDSNILHQTIPHPTHPSLLQQSISQHTESGLLQASSQAGEESLMQSEDLAGMQLISGECGTALQCDMSAPQTSLSMDSLGHTAALSYNDSVAGLRPQYDLTHNISHTSGIQNSCQLSGSGLSQSIQPTFITTTMPISSLLHPPQQQSGNGTLADGKVVYAHQTTKQTLQNSAIALDIRNLTPNIVAALASSLFQANRPQATQSNKSENQTQNEIPIAPAPTVSASNVQSSSAGQPVTVLKRILPDTQKPSAVQTSAMNVNSIKKIPVSAVLSGSTVYCTPTSQLTSQLESQTFNPILDSAHVSVISSNTVQSQPIVAPAVTMATPIVQSQSVQSQEVVEVPSSSSTTILADGTTQLPMSMMSSQEPASDVQALQHNLTQSQLQSLGQIIFNTQRNQEAVSPSLPQLDAQQLSQLNYLRQVGFNLSDSDAAMISNIPTSMSNTPIISNVPTSMSNTPIISNIPTSMSNTPIISNLPTSMAANTAMISSMPTSISSNSGIVSQTEAYPMPPSSLSPILSSQFQIPNILPSVALSPSEAITQNMAPRLYMTSPMTTSHLNQEVVTQGKADGHHDSVTMEHVDASSPAFTLANMSVIDMLLKHPTDLPDVDRAALPHKETTQHATQTKTPKLTGIYCVDCNNSYKDGCQYHKTDYISVPDGPILPRAKLTLPACCCLQTSGVKITSESINKLGIYANKMISTKTEFGPLVGKVVSEEAYNYTSSFTWKVFYNGRHDVIDTSDENDCNWLIYVKPAKTLEEQNVVVYQRGEELYFVTNKNIEAGCELLFWFAKDYARLLGLPAKPSQLWPTNCPFCHECSRVFSSWKALSQHTKTEHPNSSSRKWPCQMCNRRFTTSTKLKTHMVSLHMRLKPFSCTQCGKKFSDQSNLRQHLHIHTGEKRFQCSACPSVFRQKAHLQSHMIIHTGSEGLQCRFCPSKLLRPSDLKAHELKHTKEKCYPCALCVKVFYKLSNYKKHMLVHNKERNFHCQDCGKSFYSKYHLTRHHKTCKGGKLGDRDLVGGADENLYSTLEQDPQVEIGIVDDDNMIGNTTTSICARLKNHRQDR